MTELDDSQKKVLKCYTYFNEETTVPLTLLVRTNVVTMAVFTMVKAPCYLPPSLHYDSLFSLFASHMFIFLSRTYQQSSTPGPLHGFSFPLPIWFLPLNIYKTCFLQVVTFSPFSLTYFIFQSIYYHVKYFMS